MPFSAHPFGGLFTRSRCEPATTLAMVNEPSAWMRAVSLPTNGSDTGGIVLRRNWLTSVRWSFADSSRDPARDGPAVREGDGDTRHVLAGHRDRLHSHEGRVPVWRRSPFRLRGAVRRPCWNARSARYRPGGTPVTANVPSSWTRRAVRGADGDAARDRRLPGSRIAPATAVAISDDRAADAGGGHRLQHEVDVGRIPAARRVRAARLRRGWSRPGSRWVRRTARPPGRLAAPPGRPLPPSGAAAVTT